jgi:hypothetical protein
MIPAMITVVDDTGFFWLVSLGTSFAISGFFGSLTGAGTGTVFSTDFTGDTGWAVFSPGSGTAFSLDFTGSSAFTTGSAGDLAASAGVVPEPGGAAGAALFAASAGAAEPVGIPQLSQNFAFGPSAAPHFGQTGDTSIFAPQDSQNFIPGVTELPHFWQFFGFSVMNIHLRDWALLNNFDSNSNLSRSLYAFCFSGKTGKMEGIQTIFAPQLLQNLRPGLSDVPHWGQNFLPVGACGGAAPFCPE